MATAEQTENNTEGEISPSTTQVDKNLVESADSSKIEEFKKEKINLSRKFTRRSSLILRIVNIYLVLTLVNLIVFWVIMGADKFRLISENGKLSQDNQGYLLLNSLRSTIEDEQKMQRLIASSGDEKQSLLRELEENLRRFKGAKALIVKNYALILENGNLIHRYPNKWFSEKEAKSKKTIQAINKALQLKSQKNQAFFGDLDVFDARIDIYLPMTNQAAQQMVFFTRIKAESIQSELRSLFVFGGLMVGFLLILQGVSGFLIYRAVLLPIKRLVSGADRVAQADLTVQVEQGKNDDELDHLIYTFNLMVAALDEKTGKLESTISELESYNEIIQSELDMAQDIQQGILPDMDASERIAVGVFYAPLEKVSGDYYDLFSLPDGNLGVLMGDVSGHGIPAALITIMAKTHFTALAPTIAEPGELLERINTEMCEAISTADYMTAFYCKIDSNLNLRFANASHQKGLIYKVETKSIEELAAPGFALGAVDEPPIPYMTMEHQMQPGDRLILYSDGIIEAMNHEKELYGKDRFNDRLVEWAHHPVQKQVDLLIEDMDAFAEGYPRKDDITVLIIEVQEADLDRQVLIEKGIAHYKEKEFMRSALIFESLIANEDRNPNIKWHLANCYFFLQRYDEAIKLYSEFAKIKNSAMVYLRIGLAYYKQENFDAAIEQYNTALELKKGYAEAYAQLAVCYGRKGERALALENIKKALARNSEQKRYKNIYSRLEGN